MLVNFYERYQPSNQIKIIEDALLTNSLASDGKYALLLGEHFFQRCNIQNILFTTSATTALELAVQLLQLKPGDEVIIPSFNFPSAANAVLKYGGIPILCDIDLLTKNISLEDAASRINRKTKAIIPTHYAGISCDMDKLIQLAADNNITIIEDAAQGVHSYYKQASLGSIGDFGAYSFHHTKNFSCGEGGAFIYKKNDFMQHAEMIRDNGTNKAQFTRNLVSHYSWCTPGSNYILSEACAALLYSQLLEYNEIIYKRRSIANNYNALLTQILSSLGEKISLMDVPYYSSPNYHIYYINCANLKIREILRKYLLMNGIDARTHFIPLHTSTYGKELGYQQEDLPNSLAASKAILRLPIHTELTAKDTEIVVDHILQQVSKL